MPLSIIYRYYRKVQTRGCQWVTIEDLEHVWEAYKSMLIEQAVEQIHKEQEMIQTGISLEDMCRANSRSNMQKMVSITKLREKARVFMNKEEIFAIETGQLREYLDQFIFQEVDEESRLQLESINFSVLQSKSSLRGDIEAARR